MRLVKSELKNKIIETHHFDLGNLYLFDNFLVSEINEGKHISIDTADDYLSAISEFYGEHKPFGFISNRVNSFSVEALDFPKFTAILKNLKAFSIISYKTFGGLNINTELEQQFCNIPYKKFNSLTDAQMHLNDFINANKLVTTV